MKTFRNAVLLFLTLLLAAITGYSQTTQRQGIIGAGASFPAPLITAWADEYRKLTSGGVTVNYQSIGSGGGIRQFIEQTIMFGATEAALNDKQMSDIKQRTGGLAFNLPITLGDVVITYNVPGVQKGLVLNSNVIADAFLGKITRWNDPKIAALNPGINLPNLPIQIAHRSDGSGTTAIFTDYLSKTSSEWKSKVGQGTSVNWAIGSGGKGNEGVAGIVKSTPGAMGYNSLVYAVLNNLSYGSVINKSRKTIAPSLEATSLSAAVKIPRDGRISLTDTKAPKGYPITGFAWVLVYENLDKNSAIKSENDARELVKFLYWMITEGQNHSEKLSFARLPRDAQKVAEGMLTSLKYNKKPVGREVVNTIKARGFK